MGWFLTAAARGAIYRWMTGEFHRRQWDEWFEFCRRAAAVTGKDEDAETRRAGSPEIMPE